MNSRTEALLAKLRERIAAAPPASNSPVYALGGMDAVTRESHIKMIGHLRKRYGMQVLVDQAIFGRSCLEDLSDDELVDLHRDLERARECLSDGISLEDAGLLRNRYG